MVKIFCDRCGKEIFDDCGQVMIAHSKSKVCIRNEKSRTLLYTEKTLCPQCDMEYYCWFMNPKMKEKL